MPNSRSSILRRSLTLATLVMLLAATSSAQGALGTVPASAAADHTAAPACTGTNPWQAAPAMNTPRVGGATVVANGYVFVLGGFLMTPYWHEIDSVESAPIGADGTLGAWTDTRPLTSINQALGAVATDDYVYVIGGWDRTNGLTRVERAAVLPDGQLGVWEPQTPLPDPFGRINLSTVMTGTFVYALGGFNYSGADVSHSVLRTTIQPDGSVGAWSDTSSMLQGRRSFGAVAAGNYLYVVGGSELNNAGAGQSVERAEINADGTLGAWESLPALLRPRVAPVALVDGGYLYAIGGAPSNYLPTTNTVERAAIQPDGTLGPWQYVDNLLAARVGHSGVSANGHFYIMGGHAGHDTGDYAQVNSSEQVAAADLAPQSENGLSINNGALFTNHTGVTLTVSAQPGTTQMQLSNDGGFVGASWQDCVASVPWTITSYGGAVLPRVVYVRFKAGEQTVSGTYFDDIILDVTAPSGGLEVQALVAAEITAPFSSAETPTGRLDTDNPAHLIYLPLISHNSCAGAGCPPTVLLLLNATDDASGVGSMEIGNDPAFSYSQWEPFAATKAWYLPPGLTTVYARFRDQAGNISAAVSATIGP